MTYTYSITGVDDGSGEEFETEQEAEDACRSFLRGGVLLPGADECVTEFADWMVLERDGGRQLLCELADEHEADCYEDEGEAAFGRQE